MAKKESKSAASSGRFAYEGLERAIHEKARLGIMTSLMTRPEGLSFNELKELCDLTDGNLNRHLEVLSEEGLVSVRKEEGSGRGRTLCKITGAGRTRFKEYLEELERVIADAAAANAAAHRLSAT